MTDKPLTDEVHFHTLCGNLDQIAYLVQRNSAAKGFYPPGGKPDKSVAHYMGMVVTELAEVIEADRAAVKVDPPTPGVSDYVPMSEKIKGFTLMEEEVADAIIRLLDFAHAHGLRVSAAVASKHIYNTKRPYRHGKAY
jgi:hypothetical protein